MSETETDGLLLTRIVIERFISEDGDNVTAEFCDSNGDMPGLVEILGMLELTKDTALRAAMGDDEDNEP